jgi:hypothetical protein
MSDGRRPYAQEQGSTTGTKRLSRHCGLRMPQKEPSPAMQCFLRSSFAERRNMAACIAPPGAGIDLTVDIDKVRRKSTCAKLLDTILAGASKQGEIMTTLTRPTPQSDKPHSRLPKLLRPYRGIRGFTAAMGWKTYLDFRLRRCLYFPDRFATPPHRQHL